MNGFTPEDMSRGGDAAAAVAAVAAASAAAASAGNGAGAGAGAEVPGAGAVSAAGPPGAAGPGPGQLCCLREDGERCGRAAGNASFSKRIQKSISQKKVKIELDKSVSDGGTHLLCPPPGALGEKGRRVSVRVREPQTWVPREPVPGSLVGSKQQSAATRPAVRSRHSRASRTRSRGPTRAGPPLLL